MTAEQNTLLDTITCGDCSDLLTKLPPQSMHVCVSDIPYGISLDEWDVLHPNTNRALLGVSPAQIGKSAFRRRGKPINGWSSADRAIPKEYQEWCMNWAVPLFSAMKKGASVFIFCSRRHLPRAIVALEDAGFLLRDILCWEKTSAHHRAQRLDNLIMNRGLAEEAERWRGWRVGNLAPLWEPIGWFFKPYDYTILDNVLEHEVGGINIGECLIDGSSPTNILRFENDFSTRQHEAQKPLALIEYLIRLTTREGQIVLDPFVGSGTTAVAAKRLNRHYVGFDINPRFVEVANARLVEECSPDALLPTTRATDGQLPLLFERRAQYTTAPTKRGQVSDSAGLAGEQQDTGDVMDEQQTR